MRDLVGRRSECAQMERLLDDVCLGRSGTLVVRGEAGIGKTALLEYAAEVARDRGCQVQETYGAESESHFAFAGLQQLLAPSVLDGSSALPEPQRAAMEVALGLEEGPAPDRFLIGLATLNLLADVADDTPLLCLVDDAQWLDQASVQVLAFVARRVSAERLALVLAARDTPEEGLAFAGLTELRLTRLGDADARALLAAEVRRPLDGRVRERIIAEARGNPLALLETPRRLRAPQFAGGFEPPHLVDVPLRVEEMFRRRSARLPPDAQLLLLVAAAESTGDIDLLWRAAAELQIARDAAADAETAGLVEFDIQVRFRHPLVRSAVCRAAAPPDRRRAHEALAAATDPRTDPDRRAWHRAQAALLPDEGVAEELEMSAGRARRRGGSAAAAAFLRRAAELTQDPQLRSRRTLAAAYAAHDAGAWTAALELALVAEKGSLDDQQRAHLALLRAQIAFHTTGGSDAPRMLLVAAGTLAPLDAGLSRESLLQAMESSFHVGRLGRGDELSDAARAARAAPAPSSSVRPVDLMLEGLATLFTQGYEASVPALQRSLETLRTVDPRADHGSRRRLWLACHIARTLWDDEAMHEFADLDLRLARETGELARLPAALNAAASVLVLTGELAAAADLLAEESEVTRAIGATPLLNAGFILAAWRGQETVVHELCATLVEQGAGPGEGAMLALSDVALAVLHNGLGDFEEALAAAARPVEHDELTFASVALPELVEAGVRAGRPEDAAAALEVLNTRARASGTDFARGLEARSRALLDPGPTAEPLYRDAIQRLGRTRMATHLARAHLVYGEWLRRESRRQDAREQLRTAHDMLVDMGADAFAARAAGELRAVGGHPRERGARPSDALTAQELHVARLVVTGATSREVAAQLFVSPRTVEAHLRTIFRKLGITSRRQLRGMNLS